MGKRKQETKSTPWSLQIYVPEGRAAGQRSAVRQDESVTTHSATSAMRKMFGGRVEELSQAEMEEDWKAKLTSIVALAGAASEAQKGWHVDSVEIGLTLSAKGHLLFVAEAGVEGSVRVTLKRT